MATQKTKQTPRHVTVDGIRFAGRTFSPPELAAFSGCIVHVAYDHFTDGVIDILDGDMHVIAQCQNRPAAIAPAQAGTNGEAV